MPRLTLDYLPPDAFCDPVVWRYGARSLAEPHSHTFHEVLWIEAGEGLHAINGQVRPMSPGYLALIRPDDTHTFSAREGAEEMRLCNVPFRPGLWRRLRRAHLAGRPAFFDEPDIERREHQLGPVELERVRALASDLFGGATDAFSTTAFLAALLAFLGNRERRRRASGETPGWLRDAHEAVQRFPRFVGGVPAFVRLSGRSPEHVARECRRHLGRAPREIVNEARLAHATTRLRTSTDPIVEIAHESGFENLGHFYALFRRRHGLPPRRYRLLHGHVERGRWNDQDERPRDGADPA